MASLKALARQIVRDQSHVANIIGLCRLSPKNIHAVITGDYPSTLTLNSLEDAEAEMRKRSVNSELYFAIVLKETGKVIGEIEAFPERNEPDNESSPIDTFSPCWMLNPAFHRKGYAFEAPHAFFEYLFQTKGARRIYAYTEDTNLRSQHLCEKLGMRREGMFIEFVSFVKNPDGTPRYENTFQYAILKREWDQMEG